MSTPPLVNVKVTLDRWLEDKMEERGLSRAEVAIYLGISDNKLGRVLNDPPSADAAIIHGLAELFKVIDWFDVLVKEFGFGTEACSINDLNRLLQPSGHQLDVVYNAAA